MKFFRRLKKHLPTHHEIEQYRYIHVFGDAIKQRELWTFNRASTSKGIAIGLFCAFLPMPFEMVVAIFMAVVMGGNLPFAIASVFVSNPFTWVPLYTPCYLLGSHILQIEPIPLDQINILQLGWHYVALWLGCLIVGTCVGFASHFLINLLWRSQVRQEWQERRHRRQNKKLNN